MTLNEFLHWLEGFKEGINKAPTENQWKKIQDKLKEIKIEKEEKPHYPFPINVPHKTSPYNDCPYSINEPNLIDYSKHCERLHNPNWPVYSLLTDMTGTTGSSENTKICIPLNPKTINKKRNTNNIIQASSHIN